jgi:hypothetical protein
MVGNSSDRSHISLSNGVLTLLATAVLSQLPSTSNPFPAIHYFSGKVYSKVQVNADGSMASDSSGRQIHLPDGAGVLVDGREWSHVPEAVFRNSEISQGRSESECPI